MPKMNSGKDSSPHPRRVFFGLLVLSYVLIHLKFEYDFWFVPDSLPFAKFTGGEGVAPDNVAGKAYLAAPPPTRGVAR